MPRGFLRSVISTIVLLGLLVVTIINVWQSNRIEKNQIELLNRIDAVEKAIENGDFASAGGPSGPSGGIFGVSEPPEVTAALMDANNQFSRDNAVLLPSDAKQGGTLNLKMGSDPKGFNWLVENGADVSEIQNYVHVSLGGYHQRCDPLPRRAGLRLADLRGQAHPHLKLRKDFQWHKPQVDWASGRFDWLKGDHPVTAHDVVFMLDLLTNDQVAGAAPLRSYFDELESYEALDDYTFQIKFKKPKYMQKVMVPGLYPLPKFLYAYDEAGEAYEPEVIGKRFEDHWYNPMGLGAGPYVLTRFEPGVAIELERNPKSPLAATPWTRWCTPSSRTKTNPPRKLRTGELHLSGLQPAQYRAEVLEGEDDSFKDGTIQGGEFWSYNYFYIGWNADRPLFSDKRVRQAMSHAFNAQLLIDDVFLGLGERTTGPMPTVQPYYDRSLEPYAFDLERAKALLDEAGWTDSDGDGIRDKEVDGTLIPFEFKLVVFGHPTSTRPSATSTRKTSRRSASR